MDIFNSGKLNAKIKELTKELAEVKADRDLQVSKIAEMEKATKEVIETVQSVVAEKETAIKQIEAVKETAAKEIEAVKESVQAQVVEESIKLVASQGTTVVIEPSAKVEQTEQDIFRTFKSLKGQEKQNFYNKNSSVLGKKITN